MIRVLIQISLFVMMACASAMVSRLYGPAGMAIWVSVGLVLSIAIGGASITGRWRGRVDKAAHILLVGVLTGVGVVGAREGHPYAAVLLGQLAGIAIAFLFVSSENTTQAHQTLVMSAIEDGARTGQEIAEKTGITSLAVIYSILNRLEGSGEIFGFWGDASETRGGYRRRYYKSNRVVKL